ncbi:DUF934 domain-containing protein [Burkholderia vietnamiensis]|uniref:DUF934 domain-containing protein n=1 Tax=Burkholderia vietnamiensis TaxID=60552 RepID=UPI0007554170|nr:DUF934 domain-containing protein [Burkholderia vietnamiensis]KVE71291.1 hypothetical protein WI97_03650 [Burkholderia vietnamiensis]KVE77671.1 hypothetical protein WI98_05770 [Burkholderia vietnamiensis]KVE96352.1 hypothetical protein WJ01_10985 [Burkholderia vietnamiensis]KVF17554.1 hypothetical protein WJ07_28745 [Burkholderia vietnamiensis]CAG9191785.1 Oxidoreductase probably involved in sulfite reduction [Burkholderia vietnamiensis]
MNAVARIRLLDAGEHAADAAPSVLTLPNDADPRVYALQIATATRVDLHFPSFTDGRAYSQAYYLRRRLGFKGDLRATGEVLVDQLQQMERMGFSSAVLKEGSDSEAARRQLERFAAFYQGDVTRAAPYREQDVDR